jgi:hypothetical protein
MNIRAKDLEVQLDEIGLDEKTYGVLVTDIATGTQMSVQVDARADVSAATTARYAFYCTFGSCPAGVITHTVVIGNPELRIEA